MSRSTLHQSPVFTPGRCLIALVNIVTLFGPFLADWNETHIYNPNWPPHARYHNGQTMSLGLFVGLLTYYILFITIPSCSSTPDTQKIHLNWVLVLQNFMYLSSLSGILYPGAGWADPEFGDDKPQLYVFPWLVVGCWIGWYLERRRIDAVGKAMGKGKGE